MQLDNLKGEVWIDDQQGRMVPANAPYIVDREFEDITGNQVKSGDIGISFENT